MEFNMEWNVICRVCLQEGEMCSVFDKDEDDLLIADKIMLCSNLKILQGQNMPEQICSKCLAELNAAYKFRSKCESSNAVLEAFTKGDVSNDYVMCSVKGKVYKYEPPAGLNVKRIRKSDPLTEVKETPEDEPPVDAKKFMLVDDIIAEDYDENSYEPTDGFVQYQISEISVDDISNSTVWESNELQATSTTKKSSTKRKSTGPRQPRNKGEKCLHICELCGNFFKYKHALETHMRRHRNEKPFSCEICGRAFVLNVELTCHMRTHTGQKPYACRFCDRRFSDFGSRIKHERSHTGERPYACGTCGKAFAYSYGLSSHMLTHTGEKPYGCDKCGKRFTKKHHLTNHLKTHLKQEMKQRAQTHEVQQGEQTQQIYVASEDLLTVLKNENQLDQYIEHVTVMDADDEQHTNDFDQYDVKPVVVFDPAESDLL